MAKTYYYNTSADLHKALQRRARKVLGYSPRAVLNVSHCSTGEKWIILLSYYIDAAGIHETAHAICINQEDSCNALAHMQQLLSIEPDAECYLVTSGLEKYTLTEVSAAYLRRYCRPVR